MRLGCFQFSTLHLALTYRTLMWACSARHASSAEQSLHGTSGESRSSASERAWPCARSLAAGMAALFCAGEHFPRLPGGTHCRPRRAASPVQPTQPPMAQCAFAATVNLLPQPSFPNHAASHMHEPVDCRALKSTGHVEGYSKCVSHGHDGHAPIRQKRAQPGKAL